MSKILVLDLPAGSARMTRALGGRHDVVEAHSSHVGLLAAEAQSFDLILVGLHFDDSRMFETFSALRSNLRTHSIPLVGFAALQSDMATRFKATLEASVRAFGAIDYIDATILSDAELARRIEQCLRIAADDEATRSA